MAGAQHDPPVTDVRQVRSRDSQADPGQCRRHGLPRTPDELLIAHPGDREAASAQQPGLALHGHPSGGRLRGRQVRHDIGLTDRVRAGHVALAQ